MGDRSTKYVLGLISFRLYFYRNVPRNPADVGYWKFQGLLYAHDAVAQKDYYPHLPEIPRDTDTEDEETIKIVQLVKSNEPLVSYIFLEIVQNITHLLEI